MAGAENRHFLDRPAARLAAFAILLLCAAGLAYLHRDDLWPTADPSPVAADDPAAACIQERFAGIDGMVTEGTIEAAQADLFKQRAEAMCRATTGRDGPPPSALPGLPTK